MEITEIQVCSPDVEDLWKIANLDPAVADNLIRHYAQIRQTNANIGKRVVHFSLAVKKVDRKSPFVLKAVQGLDPQEIMYTYNDGPAFFRMRPSERVVSLLINLNPNYPGQNTVGDLRDSLYRLISYNTNASTWNSDALIELRFFNDDKYIASLMGFAQRFESNPFRNETDVEFTIQCPFPFLKSTEEINLRNNIVNSSNVSHKYFNGITYQVDAQFTVNDTKSTAPHGFKMVCRCFQPPWETIEEPPKFIIWDSRSTLFYIFSTTFGFRQGDEVHFSSEEDNRYIYVKRGGSRYSLINKIYWGSVWPFLYPGENLIEVSEGFSILEASHSETYWGV